MPYFNPGSRTRDSDAHGVCSFLSLVGSIAKIIPYESTMKHPVPTAQSAKVLATFQYWVDSLKKPLPPRTGVILFRLLFPHEDVRRRYDLQERRLSKLLSTIFELGHSTEGGRNLLARWSSSTQPGASGCLGDEVRLIVAQGFAMVSLWPYCSAPTGAEIYHRTLQVENYHFIALTNSWMSWLHIPHSHNLVREVPHPHQDDLKYLS